MGQTKQSGRIMDLAKLVGIGLVGVPALAAYLGHTQKEVESNLETDKEFTAQRAKLKLYDEAISAMREGNQY